MKKPYKPSIPFDELPEGIRFCTKNCKRLWNDAKNLYDLGSYASAILLLILAKEEFAKALLLLKHEKDKQDVDDKKVKQYFGDHEIRLEEFGKYFHKSLGSNIDKKFASMSIFDIQTREKYTYVDWGQLGWSYPEYNPPKHWNIKDDSVFDKHKVESFMTDLKQVFWKIEQDTDFQKAIQKPEVDKPTGDILHDIIKEVTKLEKPTTKTEIKQSKIKIELEIVEISKKTEFEKGLNEKISKRFPKHKLNVIIKKKMSET